MLVYINEAIQDLLDENKPTDIAETLGVSQALISTWKCKENDFTPRVGIAAKIYSYYDIVVFPYSEEALQEVIERAVARAAREW